MTLDGTIAVVTGGARGLGRALAERLASDGGRVAIADIDEAGAVATARELALIAPTIAIGADCATADGVRAVLDAVESAWDRQANALVNNAGVLSHADVLDIDDAEIERVLRVNTMGPMVATRELARRLVASGAPGAVVNITSTCAHVASLPGLGVYGASKGGLLAWTRAAAADLARRDIRVNAVAPGWMRTDMSQALDDPSAGAGLQRRIPMRRAADPSEIAGAVSFLLSDDARYVTGTTIAVDGGWLGY